MMAKKSGFKFFYPKNSFSIYFWPKTPIKHCRNRDKSIYNLKKPIKPPQKPKSTKIKKSTRVHICFFMNFKDKKILIMNSFHQMKRFDTNIIRFGGLNRCQWHFSLSTNKIRWSLSLLSQPRTKKNKNKILYQN